MNVLIIHPKYNESFWSVSNFLNLFSGRPELPPEELISISTLLPITWERKLIDLNYNNLSKRDILKADFIIISANKDQHASTLKTIAKCHSCHKKIIACGSLFKKNLTEYESVAHIVQDDIRYTLPLLLNDLENKKSKKLYHSHPFQEVKRFVGSYYSLAGFTGKFLRNIRLSH